MIRKLIFPEEQLYDCESNAELKTLRLTWGCHSVLRSVKGSVACRTLSPLAYLNNEDAVDVECVLYVCGMCVVCVWYVCGMYVVCVYYVCGMCVVCVWYGSDCLWV